MLCLRVIGPETSRTMFFDKTSINIGRVEGNDIVLPNSQVSKQHVQIIAKEAAFILIDISSSNGTSLNGARISGSIHIKINDEINIGPYKIKILSNNFSTDVPQRSPQIESDHEEDVDDAQTEPLRRYIRRMLNFILKTDSQLDEFCVDYLPEIRKLISINMDRTAKMNLIIENADLQSIRYTIIKFYHKKYNEFVAETEHKHM